MFCDSLLSFLTFSLLGFFLLCVYFHSLASVTPYPVSWLGGSLYLVASVITNLFSAQMTLNLEFYPDLCYSIVLSATAIKA